MARIDVFIRELVERGGERLTIAAGQPVTVRADGQEMEITDHVPSALQVRRILEEIFPAENGGTEGSGSHAFAYESPVGRVEIQATLDGEASRLLVLAGESASDGVPGEEDGTPASAGAGWAAEDGGGAAATGPDAGPAPDRRDPAPGEADPEPDAAASVPSSPATALPPDDSGAPAIERLFRIMVEHGCSDLHVSAGASPLFRKDGEIVAIGEEPALGPEETDRLLMEIAPEKARREFEERRDTDFAYEIQGVARFRCNLFEDRIGVGGVFRQIPSEILTAEELGLPPAVRELCQRRKGLVVVTGPTGSGKSTTLATMVDVINRSRKEHIITIEDPIEFVHQNKGCLVNQREVGVHTRSFKAALRAALREDPDIVLVGEMRDLETVEIAMETAETGHLVFGTLHTNTAGSTVSRIIDQFPGEQQPQIRTMLADSLKGVIAQTLCRRKAGGRVAAMEILIVTSAVSNLIREDKTYQIPSVMQTGKSVGMRTMNDALLALVRDGTVEPIEAYRHAVEKSEFRGVLERNGIELAIED